MADPIQEKCLQAIKGSLDTLAGIFPGLDAAAIVRGRPRPFAAADTPAINQVDGDDDVTDYTSTTELHEVQVDIEGYMTDASYTALQSFISDFQAQVWQAVKAAQADPNIINVLHGGTPRDREDEEGAPPLLAFTLTAIVQYQTARGDPYSIG